MEFKKKEGYFQAWKNVIPKVLEKSWRFVFIHMLISAV